MMIPHPEVLRRCWLVLGLTVLVAGLAGCSLGAPLLEDVAAVPTMIWPARAEGLDGQAGREGLEGVGETLDLRYRVGREATVSIYLEDAGGQRFALRRAQPRSPATGAYTLRFDGTIPVDDPVVQRRLLPGGEYTLVVEAQGDDGESAVARAPVTILGNMAPLPAIQNLTVWPETISPNADAIADIAEITYRLPVTATIDLTMATPAGEVLPLVARQEAAPAEQRHVWNGKRPNGATLPGGVYTYTLRAEDGYGQIVQRQGTLRLVDVGQPEATIVEARIAPRRLMLGEVLTVTLRVRNTGPVPIRTYGPPSGYTYTTDEVYSSVAGGRYAAQAGGFWRVGMDWDANSGGGPRRYPFRWALSADPPEAWDVPGVEDWLLPGEEVEIVGQVVVLQRETRMGFYVGLIQDGVGFFQDRTARTIVEVGF